MCVLTTFFSFFGKQFLINILFVLPFLLLTCIKTIGICNPFGLSYLLFKAVMGRVGAPLLCCVVFAVPSWRVDYFSFFSSFRKMFFITMRVYYESLTLFFDYVFSCFYIFVLPQPRGSIYWFSLTETLAVSLSWRLTFTAVIMAITVMLVASLIIFYSFEYMARDPNRLRFLVHLFFFSLFMLLFIVSDDLITLFIGWEGIGLSSFCLINFWYSRVQATKAAFKALLINKIGDSALLLGIIVVFVTFGTINLWELQALSITEGALSSPYIVLQLSETSVISIFDLITLLFFIGAMAKSAQLGLHTWLPDAMEGPTPVSALLHAATMVTAGVLLLIKVEVFVVLSHLGYTIATVGVLTSLFAGFVALVQHDIKKIIAYSTCSQLGFMMLANGLGLSSYAFFHLITHAFFKALLFLTAGSVIHALNGEQDIRRMGGLQRVLPVTSTAFFIGTLAIVGFPYLSGYYSKELIFLAVADESLFLFGLAWLATILTACYSIRLYVFVLWGTYRGPLATVAALHESGKIISVVLIILSMFSIFGGYMLSFLVYGVCPGEINLWNELTFKFDIIADNSPDPYAPEKFTWLDGMFPPQTIGDALYWPELFHNFFVGYKKTLFFFVATSLTRGFLYILYCHFLINLLVFLVSVVIFFFWFCRWRQLLMCLKYNFAFLYRFFIDKFFFDLLFHQLAIFFFIITSRFFRFVERGWLDGLTAGSQWRLLRRVFVSVIFFRWNSSNVSFFLFWTWCFIVLQMVVLYFFF